MKFEFWFDFASTYSYLSVMRIESLTRQRARDVVWRPFLLGAIFNQQGWNDSPFNLFPIKGEYMWKDIARLCEKMNLPFKKPTTFPRNGLLAARIATEYNTSPWITDFIKSVYIANFQYDKDISSTTVINNCLQCSGENPALIIKQAHSQKSKDVLRENTELAYNRGIFGAPSFYVGDELFWGDDRLEQAIDWLAKS